MSKNIRKYRYGVGLLAFWLAASSLALGTGEPGLSPLGGEEIDLARDFNGTALPRWEHGRFVGYHYEPMTAPPVFAYDSGGKKLFEVGLRIDGAARIRPASIAASPDGLVAISGTAYSGAGAGAPFIALLEETGRIRSVTRMSDFGAMRLCFDPVGRLWAAGTRIAYPNEPPDHEILRAYDVGEELQLKVAVLRRSSFAPSEFHPATKSLLASNGSVVVLLSPTAGELIGVSTEGEILFREPAAMPAGANAVSGLAISGHGVIHMSCRLEPKEGQHGEIGFYTRSPGDGIWKEVYRRGGPASETTYGAIMGIEGDRILVTTLLPRLRWLDLPPESSHN